MPRVEHHQALPDDAAEFIECDDEVDETADRSAEEQAMRLLPDSPRSTLNDPALVEVADETAEPAATRWFDDEEPEAPYVAPNDDVDETESVEDLLVAQHYLPPGDDAGEDDDDTLPDEE